MNSKIIGVFWQVFAYSVAISFAFLVGGLNLFPHLLWNMLVGAIAATLVIFFYSRLLKNSSIYDPFWSVQPIVIVFFVGYWLVGFEEMSLRAWVILALVSLWGIRLTFNFLRGWRGLHEQDWRYNDLKAKTGKWYPIVDLLGIQLMPTLLVFLGSVPIYYAMQSGTPFGYLDMYALIHTLLFVGIEFVADEQLRVFKRNNTVKGAALSKGLWSVSRHPNYLGEIGFWWGLVFFALAASFSYWWTAVGAILITLLFVFISIPMIDKRLTKRKHNYEALKKRIAPLIPFLK